MDVKENRPDWWEQLNEREQQEVTFALLYVDEFNHGTPGHLSLTVIAKLAKILLAITER